jgi:hypothetical protein
VLHGAERTIGGSRRPTVSAAPPVRSLVQSLVDADLAGVDGFAAGVVELVPESLDLPESPDLVSDVDVVDEEDDSVEVEVDDLDFPPRLSVL